MSVGAQAALALPGRCEDNFPSRIVCAFASARQGTPCNVEFVSVMLFKAPTADNPLPQVKLGIVELKVSTDVKNLNIEIKPDRDKLGPRETVTYTIRTTDSEGQGVPAELSLALVDKSVLSLQDDLSRKPLDAFWSRRPLSVMSGASFATSIVSTSPARAYRMPACGP